MASCGNEGELGSDPHWEDLLEKEWLHTQHSCLENFRY